MPGSPATRGDRERAGVGVSSTLKGMHRLIEDLLGLMPQHGSPWPRPARDRWLAAMAAALDLLYEEDGVPATAPDPAAGVRPVLDLRPEPVEGVPRRAKHARPSAPPG